MSDLVWRHKTEFERILPTEAQQRHKYFRCRRRIYKQMLRSGKDKVGLKGVRGTIFGLMSTDKKAEEVRKLRQERKEERLKYYEQGNRTLKELKDCTPKPVHHIMTCDGSWASITSGVSQISINY